MARGADDTTARNWFGDDGDAERQAHQRAGDDGSAGTAAGEAVQASVAPPHQSMALDETVILPRQPELGQRSHTPLYRPEDRVALLETAVIPRYRDEPDQPPTLSELAARYGLKPAGARPGVGEYLRELWRYREFIATYANGRIVAQFGQARLGRLWQVLTPLVNAGVYFLIFGLILGTSRNIDNFICYLCVGLFIFNYTQLTASTSVMSISGQIGLVRALQFPRASLPIAMSLMQLQNLLLSVVVLAGIVLVTGEPLSFEWLWLVPALALQSLFNLGLGLFLARLGAKIIDLRQLLPYILRTWMYASGVLYSVEMFTLHLPSWAAPIMHANPALVYIELARHALMEGIPMSSPFEKLWLMGGAWAAVALVLGFLYFWRGEPEYGRG